jgi:uncharacterized protein (TIGR02271 family)
LLINITGGLIMQHTLVAVFDNRSDAQNAMNELLASGFTSTDVNISSVDTTGQTGTVTGSTTRTDDVHEEGIGASIKHFFNDLFGADNDEHVSRYSDVVGHGRHVLTLVTQSEPEVERAADIIERFGPVDIDEGHDLQGSSSALGTTYQPQSSSSLSAGSMQSGTQSGSLSSSQSTSLQRDTAIEGERTTAIPVVQEDLKIGKREVQRGGVRVFSRVVETPVNESVNLREEHVNVERRPVDQPISPADAAAFKEQSIELREKAEEAVVQKSARVVEEVVVGKEVSQRQENITDTVRHTEVQVENLPGDTSLRSSGSALDDDTYFRKDWQSNYASAGGRYEDYAPAYRYGTEVRSKYQGRNWDDVETDLRSDWDARYGSSASSTWEKMKSAVRRGWDRTTS